MSGDRTGVKKHRRPKQNVKNQDDGVVLLQNTERVKVLKRLLDSEKRYVYKLEKLIKSLAEPMATMSLQETSMIFGNIRQIKDEHKIFLKEMKELISHVSGAVTDGIISTLFISHATNFYLYICYAQKQTVAAEHLKRVLEENAELSCFLTKQKEKELMELLALPLERILYYPTILAELLSKTPMEHKDHFGLTLVNAIFKVIMDKLETSHPAEGEAHAKLSEIQRDLIGLSTDLNLITPTRNLESEWDLIEIVKAKKKRRKEPRHIYIFNDLIIIAKANQKDKGKASSNLIFDGWLPLDKISVEKSQGGNSIQIIQNKNCRSFLGQNLQLLQQIKKLQRGDNKVDLETLRANYDAAQEQIASLKKKLKKYRRHNKKKSKSPEPHNINNTEIRKHAKLLGDPLLLEMGNQQGICASSPNTPMSAKSRRNYTLRIRGRQRRFRSADPGQLRAELNKLPHSEIAALSPKPKPNTQRVAHSKPKHMSCRRPSSSAFKRLFIDQAQESSDWSDSDDEERIYALYSPRLKLEVSTQIRLRKEQLRYNQTHWELENRFQFHPPADLPKVPKVSSWQNQPNFVWQSPENDRVVSPKSNSARKLASPLKKSVTDKSCAVVATDESSTSGGPSNESSEKWIPVKPSSRERRASTLNCTART